MKAVSRRSATLLVGVAAAAVAVAITATGATARSARATQVCVLLPDTTSSVRWQQFDAPAFKNAFKKAGVSGDDRERARSAAEDARAGRAVHHGGREGRGHHRYRPRHVDLHPEEVQGRGWQDDRLRPSDHRRHRLRLYLVRQPRRGSPAGARRSRRHEGEGHVRPERRRRASSGAARPTRTRSRSRAATTLS